MSDSLFCCCLEISFRPQDVFGALWCVGTFLFHVIVVVKHIYKSTPLLFWMNSWSVKNKSNQSSSSSFFVFLLFVVISHTILEFCST